MSVLIREIDGTSPVWARVTSLSQISQHRIKLGKNLPVGRGLGNSKSAIPAETDGEQIGLELSRAASFEDVKVHSITVRFSGYRESVSFTLEQASAFLLYDKNSKRVTIKCHPSVMGVRG